MLAVTFEWVVFSGKDTFVVTLKHFVELGEKNVSLTMRTIGFFHPEVSAPLRPLRKSPPSKGRASYFRAVLEEVAIVESGVDMFCEEESEFSVFSPSFVELFEMRPTARSTFWTTRKSLLHSSSVTTNKSFNVSFSESSRIVLVSSPASCNRRTSVPSKFTTRPVENLLPNPHLLVEEIAGRFRFSMVPRKIAMNSASKGARLPKGWASQ